MGFRILKNKETLTDQYGVSATFIKTELDEMPSDAIKELNQSIKEKRFSWSYPHVDGISLDDNASYFGAVLFGYVDFEGKNRLEKTHVWGGSFFSGQFRNFLISDATELVLIKVPNYRAPIVQGIIEPQGRLKYIDGAFNSLLMSPPKKGDPCLNALYMAGKIDQTPHTHPSTRIGFILRGQVTVRIWDKEGEGAIITDELLLTQGNTWFMEKDTVHSFHTEADDDMCLFAFHPDSDFGPTDEEAPMINRTIIEGVSSRGENEPGKRFIKNIN